jgi:hypothetical protein
VAKGYLQEPGQGWIRQKVVFPAMSWNFGREFWWALVSCSVGLVDSFFRPVTVTSLRCQPSGDQSQWQRPSRCDDDWVAERYPIKKGFDQL